jgi:hypothetical protein
MTKKNRRRANGKSSNSVDQNIVNSHKATGSTSNVVRSDLTSKRQNFNIVQRPPKNLITQNFWCEMTIDDMVSLSNTAVTEVNVVFSASNFSTFANAAAFFDQYCIYAVTTTIATLVVEASFGAVQCYTAIDYDSGTNIGKAALQGYSTFNYTSLGPGGQSSLIRFLKPCIANQVTSSNLPVPGGVARQWLDVAYPSIQHYGLRNIFDVYSASVTNAIHRVHTAVFGFRNNT